MSDVKVIIHGLAEFKQLTASLPDRMRNGILRKLMRESMKLVRQDARAAAPTLAKPVLTGRGVPVRMPGTLKRAISVRTSKEEAKAGNVGMFVNVRPLLGNVFRGRGPSKVLVKKSQRSKANPRDPYYWRWIEFGTGRRTSLSNKKVQDHNGKVRWVSGSGANRGSVRPFKFLQKAADALQPAFENFKRNMQQWINNANKTGNLDA